MKDTVNCPECRRRGTCAENERLFGGRPPLSSALAGVTPGELRCLAADIHINADASPRRDRAAAILRALADSIEKTEGKP